MNYLYSFVQHIGGQADRWLTGTINSHHTSPQALADELIRSRQALGSDEVWVWVGSDDVGLADAVAYRDGAP